MIWSLILYVLLLLFAIRMILRLAPSTGALPRITPSDRVRLEFSPTRLPRLDVAPFGLDVEPDVEDEKELVGV